MRNRALAALAGLVLSLIVLGAAYLVLAEQPTSSGTYANQPLQIIVFGLACAFAAPPALSLFAYACGLDRDGPMTRLTRVPEISKLIQQVDVETNALAALKKEKADLERIIADEVSRGILLERQGRLLQEAERLVAAIEVVDQELTGIVDREMSAPTSEAVAQLRARLDARRRGGLVVTFGQRAVAINPSFFGPSYFLAAILFESTSVVMATLVEAISVIFGTVEAAVTSLLRPKDRQ
jgi:hypothetical protein